MSESDATPGPGATVTLREITKDTFGTILGLKVAPEQNIFVANNAFSIAQAHFEPKAWFRAIYADETPIGFIMLSDDDEKPEYFLWRLMLDARHQGKGYGRQAIARLVEYVRTRPNARELLVSYHPGDGSPRDFYLKLGFQETGQVEDGEIVLRLPLT
jgi:diamine N-acetyltransferase